MCKYLTPYAIEPMRKQWGPQNMQRVAQFRSTSEQSLRGLGLRARRGSRLASEDVNTLDEDELWIPDFRLWQLF
jgi:hypothetical protein